MMKMAETDFDRVVNALLPKLLLPAHMRDAEARRDREGHGRDHGQGRLLPAAGGDHRSRRQPPSPRRQIKCPTLVLCGREDTLTPVALHQEMANAIPGSRLVVAEQCGHLSTLEQPQTGDDEPRALAFGAEGLISSRPRASPG